MVTEYNFQLNLVSVRCPALTNNGLQYIIHCRHHHPSIGVWERIVFRADRGRGMHRHRVDSIASIFASCSAHPPLMSFLIVIDHSLTRRRPTKQWIDSVSEDCAMCSRLRVKPRNLLGTDPDGEALFVGEWVTVARASNQVDDDVSGCLTPSSRKSMTLTD